MSGFDHCKLPSGLDDVSISRDIEEEAARSQIGIKEAAAKVYEKKLAEKAAKKRAAYTNLKARVDTVNRVSSVWKDDVGLGMEAELVGVSIARKGARNSVDLAQNQLRQKYRTGFVKDLTDSGHLAEFASSGLDKEIYEAIDAMDKDMSLNGFSKESIDIANIIKKWNEIKRQDANNAGAWIGKTSGYAAPQTHDMFKLRSAAKRLGKGFSRDENVNFKAWNDFILPLLDKSTFDGIDDVGKFMRSAWEAMGSGVHLKYVSDNLDEAQAAPKGSGSLASRISQDRVFIFKDGTSSYEYNKIFGNGNLRESFVHGLDRSARATAIMRRFGANPTQTLNNILNDLAYTAEKGGIKGREKFVKQRKKIEHYMRTIDGSANIPANYMVARALANTRAWKSIAALGSSVLSSIPDVQNLATEMHYQGHGFMSGYKAALDGLIGTSEEKKRIAQSLGMLPRHMLNEFTDKFSAQDNVGGFTSRSLGVFFKLNLQNWWTDGIRHGMSLAMSHYMAADIGKSFSNLSDDMKRIFMLYDIDEGMWDAIRNTELDMADGEHYFTPEMARNISDETARSYLSKNGMDINESSIRDFKDNVEGKFRSYFLDRVEYGLLEPDAKIRALSGMGGAPGTFWGEASRFAMQFKSFSISMAYRPLARNLWGKSAENNTFSQALLKSLRNGNGEMTAIAHTIVMSTALGYVALAAKDVAKGKNPRDLSDTATFRAAFVQGGGAAIYGDFLFNEFATDSGDLAKSIAGPVPSDMLDAYSIYKTLISDKPYAEKEAAGKAFRMIINNIQETINPGYMQRVKKNLKERTGQEYIDFSKIISQ